MTASIVSGSAVEQYVAAFEILAAESKVPEWVQSVRRAAFDRFVSLDFPTTKNEDWHYTSVSPIIEEEYTLLPIRTGDVKRDDLAPFAFGQSDWHTVVFVNGRSKPAILEVLKRRLGNDAEAELRTALQAMLDIARDRCRRAS